MKPEDALSLVNEFLSLDLGKTHSGQEFKGVKLDREYGGTYKLYLNKQDCKELAEAFQILSDSLKPQG